MADKLTLVELHLHADGNEFENEMEFSSDIGDILRRRLGFGGSDEEDEEDTLDFGTDTDDSEPSSLTSTDPTADGGDTVQLDEDESDEGAAVVEIDPDADVGEDIEDEHEEDIEDEFGEDSGGRSWGRTLLVFAVLVGLALVARWYLGDDDIEDEFEEL